MAQAMYNFFKHGPFWSGTSTSREVLFGFPQPFFSRHCAGFIEARASGEGAAFSHHTAAHIECRSN